jgi:hypothetical protein
MSTVKSLTLNEITKKDKKLDEKKKITVTLPDGTNYSINIDRFFRPSKIQKYMLEFGIVMDEVKEKGIDEEALANSMIVEYMLLIRNFTSLEIPLSIAEITAYAQKMTDLEILDQIINAFDQSEVAKIERISKKVLENIPLLKNKIDQVYEQIALKALDIDKEEVEVDGENNAEESE